MRSNNNTALCKHEHRRTIRSAGGVKIQVRRVLLTIGSAEGVKIQVRCENTGK